MKKPQCSRCGRPLTDPFSIAIGMGPECRGKLRKKGWMFPKPHYRIRAGHVELTGMTGKVVEPPVGDLTPSPSPKGEGRKKRKHEKNELES